MLQQDLSILWIQLGKRVEVLKSTLSHKVIRVSHQRHKDLKHWLESDLIVVVYHQIFEKTARRSVEQPFQAAGIEVLKLQSVIIYTLAKYHIARAYVLVLSLVFAGRSVMFLMSRRLVQQEPLNAATVHGFLLIVAFGTRFRVHVVHWLVSLCCIDGLRRFGGGTYLFLHNVG